MKKKCSKCKRLKDTKDFAKNKTKSDGLATNCKLCNKEVSAHYYQINREQHIANIRLRNKEIIERNQKYVFDYLKEHPCVDCNEIDPIVLEFDHIKGKKRDSISALICHGFSLEAIQKEIKKCVVRCANCHRRKTAQQFGWIRVSL